VKRATIVLGLTGMACALAAVIALEFLGGIGENADAAGASATRADTDVAITRIPSSRATAPEVSVSILARPLFAPSRRPDRAPESATPEKTVTDLPRLTGIVTVMGKKLAIFQPWGGGKPIVGGVGTAIEGRKIEAISVDEIVMTGPDGAERIRPLPDPSLNHVSQRAPPRAPFSAGLPPRPRRRIGVTP
jgi:hypothetical protein